MSSARTKAVKALNAAGRCAAIVVPVVGLVLFARQLLGSPRGRGKPHGAQAKTTRGSQRRRVPRQLAQQQQEADAADGPQQRDPDEELVDGIHDGGAGMQLYTEHEVDMLHHQAKNSRTLLQSMQQSGLQVTSLHGDRGSPTLSDEEDPSSEAAAAGGGGGGGRGSSSYSPDLLQPLLQMLQQKVLEEPLTTSRRQTPQHQQQQQPTALQEGSSSSGGSGGTGGSSTTSEQQGYLPSHHLGPAAGAGAAGQPPLPMFDPADPNFMGGYMDDYDPSVDFDYVGPDLDYDGLDLDPMGLNFDPVNGRLFDPGSGFDPERGGYLPGAGPQRGNSSSTGSSSRTPPAAGVSGASSSAAAAATSAAAAAGGAGGWGPSAPPPPPLSQLPPFPSSYDDDQGGYIDDYDYDDDDIIMDPADEDALYAAMFNVEDWDPVNMAPYVFDPVDQAADEELGRALDALGIPPAAGGGGGGRRDAGGMGMHHHLPAAAAAAAAAGGGGGSSRNAHPAWLHEEEEAGYWSEEESQEGTPSSSAPTAAAAAGGSRGGSTHHHHHQQQGERGLRFHPQQVSQQQVQAALHHLQVMLREAGPEATAAGGPAAAGDGAGGDGGAGVGSQAS